MRLIVLMQRQEMYPILGKNYLINNLMLYKLHTWLLIDLVEKDFYQIYIELKIFHHQEILF